MKKTIAAEQFSDVHDQWHMSPALDTGTFVFFSGVTGCHADGTISDHPETQFREAFGFLADTLSAAGLSFDKIVEMTSYHIGLRRHLSDFTRVKDEFIRPPYPAWSCIGTTELITEGALVEIRVICQKDLSD
ncbi:RidA family protein [Halovulum sp. GXIMD14793]